MRKSQVTIINRRGLHARAAAKFIRLASEFESEITLSNKQQYANGKNILPVMMLAAGYGTQLELTANGRDEDRAIKALMALIENRFDEGE